MAQLTFFKKKKKKKKTLEDQKSLLEKKDHKRITSLPGIEPQTDGWKASDLPRSYLRSDTKTKQKLIIYLALKGSSGKRHIRKKAQREKGSREKGTSN